MEPLTGLPGAVQRPRHLAGHVFGHAGIDLTGQLDETGSVIEELELPREIERIDRYAVAAQPRTRVERHETERLGSGRLDNLPHIDPELVAHDGDLVHQPDIDRPESVLEQLHHFGALGRCNGNHPLHDLFVQELRQAGALRRDAADDFRRVMGVPMSIPRIDALGRKCQIEVPSHFEAGIAELGQQNFVRGARDRWCFPG